MLLQPKMCIEYSMVIVIDGCSLLCMHEFSYNQMYLQKTTQAMQRCVALFVHLDTNTPQFDF